MKNKTLIYGGIGIAVLIIGFMAYKKFGKKNETAEQEKKADVEDDTKEDVVIETQTTKSEVAPKSNISQNKITKSSLITSNKNTTSSKPASDILFKKFGISEADYEKLRAKEREVKKKYRDTPSESKRPMLKEIREFAEKNGISYGAYKKADEYKLQERSKKVIVHETTMTKFAGFMDFDANDDVQGSMM